jgi:hypothetical protein
MQLGGEEARYGMLSMMMAFAGKSTKMGVIAGYTVLAGTATVTMGLLVEAAGAAIVALNSGDTQPARQMAAEAVDTFLEDVLKIAPTPGSNPAYIIIQQIAGKPSTTCK